MPDASCVACVGVAVPLASPPVLLDACETVLSIGTSLSTLPLRLLGFGVVDLGLSSFPLPGIFDRIEPLNDRADSLVSDLLKDG